MIIVLIDIEPIITLFPGDKHVLEGEEVVFSVKVTGMPELTWYHNGEEVIMDYFKELAEDGSLTMSSVDTKCSGVYRLAAVNKAGRVEKEVSLFVTEVSQQSPHEHQKKLPIPIETFDGYVSNCHANNNREFVDQYKVRCRKYWKRCMYIAIFQISIVP